MSIRRLGFYLLVAVFLVVMVGIPTKSQVSNQKKSKDQNIIVGRNVNMVSGQTLPDGDPWLQRQNEPSIAVSTLNPLHLFAAANDYRTVDIPFTQGALPGLPIGTTAGDAWLGVFKSFDGGESWKSTLLPGYPQDTGSNFPLHLLEYNAAADPVVRAGTDGLFYVSGIGFKRDAATKEIGESAVFVARYKDFNDIGDTIEYQGAEIVEKGDALSFIDKPWIAVDIPRTGASCGNVYIVYSIFFGSKSDLENMTSEIRFARSEDCGSSWRDPIALASASAEGYFQIAKKEKKGLFQGATIAIDPQDGRIYVAWRQFGIGEKDDEDDNKKSDDAIFITMSDDGGVSFSDPIEVEKKIDPFDQGTSGATFRTNSYPTMAVDDNGIVYLAWSERKGKKKSRIVISTSKDKKKLKKWSEPKDIDNKGKGHQFMPSLAYAAGKLIVAWYDQREDISERFTEYIDDRSGEPRHTIDVRVAQADPGEKPKFEPSIQVSRYLYVLTDDGMSLYQGQFNPPNFPLFQGGTAPFHSDYIDISPSPMFMWDEVNGEWRFNTQPSDTPPVFHIVWTDNRDVKPPPGPSYDWTDYTPTDYSNPDFDSGSDVRPGCEGEHKPGMRNQNIYTSRISQGLEVGSPRNSKPLDFPRMFVVFVNNTTDVVKSFRLTIANQPPDGQASFLQFEFLTELDVTVAPNSSISRPVFVEPSSVLDASIRIDVNEIDMPGGDPVLGGLSSFVVLNPGGVTAPDPIQYEEYNPVIEVMDIVDYKNDNPVLNPNIFNPNIFNPNIFNPNIFNTDIVNPNIFNPNIFNPNIFNPNIFNPNIFNPNIFNPNIFNPNIFNASLADADVFDVVWTVRNEGDATSSYVFKTFAKDSLPEGIYAQLLIYRSHSTPATDGEGCTLGEERHHELLANIVNPNIFNPNIFNPNIFNPNIFNASIENAAFSIPPGDEVYVALRLIEPEPGTVKFLQNGEIFDLSEFAESVGGGVAAQTVNIEDAQAGIRTPPADATNLVIGTVSLPDGTVGEEYGDASINYSDATLQAVGGKPAYPEGPISYTWSLISGQLPDGLHLNFITPGRIGGVPTAEETFYFVVQVYDGTQTDTQSYSITINSITGPGPLTITTTSLPNGVEGSYYGATLEATGGQWPRRWSMASGSLPDGLSLDSGGVIGGRPSAEGAYNFTVRVTDVVGVTDTQPLSIQILASTGINVTISGTVSTGGGSPVEGVLMRGLPGTPATDASGIYSDTVPQGWSGTVEPLKVGYSFVDPETVYTPVNSNITTDYTAYSTIVDHFLVQAAGGGDIGTQTAYVPFSIKITALDSADLLVPTYSGSNTLSDSTSTISPTTTEAFANGTWTSDVTITAAGTGVTITTTGAGKTGESNAFDVIAGPPQEDIYEENDDFAQAAPITLGTHTNLAYFDEDWYKVTVPAADAGKDLKVHIQGTSYPDPGDRQDLDFGVFNVSQKMLSYNLSGSDDETVYIADLAAGDYYIGVNYFSQNGAVYTLTVEIGDSTSFGIGYISGRVTDDQETPTGIEDILVDLYPVPFDWNVSRPLITTDSQGYFTIGYVPGDYQVRFNIMDLRAYGYDWAPDRNYIGEYYDDTYSRQEGQILSIISSSTTIPGVNAELVAGGEITGTISGPSQADVTRVLVYVRNLSGQYIDRAYPDGAGDYTLNRIPTGHFKVYARPPYIEGSNFGTEWYDDKTCFDDADPVYVGAGQTVSGINIQLDQGATIQGTVTDAVSGSPLEGVNVRVYDPTQTAQIFLQQGFTDSNGIYAVGRLPGGQVRVRFLPPSGTNYVREWYNDKPIFDEADLVTTTAGQTTSDIDAQLAEGGAIVGLVTDASQNGLFGIFVVCVDVNSGNWYSASTNAYGNYGIYHVPVGNYKVRFRADYGNYATEWHNDKGSYADADQVSVAVGQETTVDAELWENGGYITGTVTANETGVEGVKVWARDSTYDATISWTFTDANGDYSIPRMPTCNAKIYFDTDVNNLPYVSEWYDDQGSYDQANLVSVTLGGTTTLYDAVLTQRSPLTITTTSLPDGTAGTPYSATLEASGGIWNYNWSLASGSGPLPDGLSLHGNGVIDGTPATPGIFSFTVQVVDSSYPPQSTTLGLSITINSVVGATKLVFTTQPGGGVGGQAWSQQPVVEVKDDADNTMTSDNLTVIAVGILNNPSSGALSGTALLAVVNGVAAFTDLSIDMGGYDYTLEVSATGLQPDTSAAFNIEGFSYTGDMNVKRLNHTATLLNDGLVLVARGENQALDGDYTGNPYNDSAENYSTATGIFDFEG